MEHVVGLREPVDDHIGLQLRQHVIAQHGLRPGHGSVLGLRCFRLRRSRTEALPDGVVDGIRESDAHARLPVTVDEHAGALPRPRVSQESRAPVTGAGARRPWSTGTVSRVAPPALGGRGAPAMAAAAASPARLVARRIADTRIAQLLVDASQRISRISCERVTLLDGVALSTENRLYFHLVANLDQINSMITIRYFDETKHISVLLE